MTDLSAVPQELKERRQWLMWDADADTPRRPHWDGDFYISWNDPSDWHTFEEAINAAEKKESYGIGFVFSGADDYLALDLDGCLNERGGPKDWLPSTEPFNGETYMERSASGTGVHVIVEGYDLPDWWQDSHFSAEEHEGVEAYEEKFFAFTGNALETSADTVGRVDPTPWLFDAYKAVRGEAPRVDTDDTQRRNGSDDVDVGVYDVLSQSSHPAGQRVAHPVHGSGTGTNFHVDEDGETWRCWRHSVTGNALHLVGMEEGLIDCGDWDGRDLGAETWADIFDAARERGLDVGEKRQQFTSAAKEAQTDGNSAKADGGTTADEANSDPSDGPAMPLRDRVQSEVLRPVDPPEDYEGERIDAKVAIQRFTDLLMGEYSYVRPREDVRGWRDTLYVYEPEEGIYEPHGEMQINEEAERLLGSWVGNQQINEIVGKIERRSLARPGELDTEPEMLCVKNGVLDLHNGELYDHSPDRYHRTKVDVAYDPDAKCPRIDEFLNEIVDSSDVPTLYRLIAHSIYGEYAAEKAAMLVGDGRNGKSVFLSLIEEFLGEYNVSHRALQEFSDNDFAANDLEGKLANIHPDMGDEMVRDLGTFKKLTGRDTMTADVKYEKPVTFENRATMLFAANRMPVMDEDTTALWRRWIYLNFPHTFDDNDPNAKDEIPKRKLMRELTAEEEFEGLLARCVEEISDWWDGRQWFPDIMSREQVREKMKRASEPVYDFAASCLRVTDDDDDYIPKEQVRQAYREYARVEGLPTKSDNALGEELLNLRDYPMESTRRRVDGQRVRAYSGVTFTQRGRQILGLDDSEDDESLEDSGGYVEEIVSVVRQLDDGDGVTKPMILGRASSQMGMTTAEQAVEKAKSHGRIASTDGERFYVTD